MSEDVTLAETASRHLIMHFTPASAYEGGGPPIMVSGDGIRLTDDAGQKYIDGLSGLFCVQIGYGYGSEVGEAAAAQMQALPYHTNWSSAHPSSVRLAAKLSELAPGDLNRVFFTSSGSAANEAAIKLVRQYHQARGAGTKTKIIARRSAYHGTTHGALSLNGVTALREPFEPLMNGVRHVVNANGYRRSSESPEAFARTLLDDIERTIRHEGADSVGAIIIEPVQNSGGAIVAPDGYAEGLRELCDRYALLLIADEVINAFGRIGAWFGSERLGYEPDLITFAKGVTSGYAPLGGLIASDSVVDTVLKGPLGMFSHGVTFGGHPLACTVALANLEIMERERVVENVRENEKYFRAGLDSLLEHPLVGDVRGLGYLYSVELVSNKATKSWDLAVEPSAFVVGLLAQLRTRGLLCRVTTDSEAPVLVQVAPPLVSTREELDEILGILRAALDAMHQSVSFPSA